MLKKTKQKNDFVVRKLKKTIEITNHNSHLIILVYYLSVEMHIDIVI